MGKQSKDDSARLKEPFEGAAGDNEVERAWRRVAPLLKDKAFKNVEFGDDKKQRELITQALDIIESQTLPVQAQLLQRDRYIALSMASQHDPIRTMRLIGQQPNDIKIDFLGHRREEEINGRWQTVKPEILLAGNGGLANHPVHLAVLLQTLPEKDQLRLVAGVGGNSYTREYYNDYLINNLVAGSPRYGLSLLQKDPEGRRFNRDNYYLQNGLRSLNVDPLYGLTGEARKGAEREKCYENVRDVTRGIEKAKDSISIAGGITLAYSLAASGALVNPALGYAGVVASPLTVPTFALGTKAAVEKVEDIVWEKGKQYCDTKFPRPF